MTGLFPVQTQEYASTRERNRRIASLESEIWSLEEDIESARDELERLRDEADHDWPTKDVLLAVYGAPGNWPVEAAA